MMTLANYGIGSSKQKDPNSAKVLSKSLQIRNRAELALKQCLKAQYRINNDKRNEIFNSLIDYYSRISFNVLIWNKYQTKQCIVDSILLLDSKFNPYKARDAFNLIEKMLINLVYLPWHNEFRKIHTYSGQFRLSVSEPLIGIEEVLKAAGFKQSPDCHMHLILPEDKMPQTDDGESVTSVIFDCMLAQVVCLNIIDVFENSCKVFTKHPEESLSGEVNCYCWIQAYFNERSHQTTERACSNIQELLNNITNHLSKLGTTLMKSSSFHNERISNSSQLDRNEDLQSSKSIINGTRDSPKLTAQERTREFLAQQAREDENLLRLSNDLLRLPSNNSSSDGSRKLVHSSSSNSGKFNDNDGLIQQRSSIRPTFGDNAVVNQQSLLNNGYNPHQRHQQALYDRMRIASSKPTESFDSFDYHSYNASGTYRTNDDSLGRQQLVDDEHHSPHNDREPLLPRIDRKLAGQPHHHQSQIRRSSVYENDFDANTSHLVKSNGLSVGHLGSGRNHFNEPYSSEPPSQSHQMSPSNHHQIRNLNSLSSSLSSSKYDNSPYKKYESRDIENNNKKLINNKSYWSCGSCTYNNLIGSEICEMCRNRKPTRL